MSGRNILLILSSPEGPLRSEYNHVNCSVSGSKILGCFPLVRTGRADWSFRKLNAPISTTGFMVILWIPSVCPKPLSDDVMWKIFRAISSKWCTLFSNWLPRPVSSDKWNAPLVFQPSCFWKSKSVPSNSKPHPLPESKPLRSPFVSRGRIYGILRFA